MNHKGVFIFQFIVLLCSIGCNVETEKKIHQTDKFELEKGDILKVINDETKAAFNRDYEGWKEKWIHEPHVVKTYMQFPDSSMTESLGWNAISGFVKTYFEEHPEPVPIPTLVNDIDVRLYGNGAYVYFHQNDSERGLKRETRLMEKENGQWKIAGMHTTIYGFKNEN